MKTLIFRTTGIAFLMILLFGACKKETSSSGLDGTYQGRFTLIKTDSHGTYPLDGGVIFSIKNSQFTSPSDASSNIVAGVGNVNFIATGYGNVSKKNDSLYFINLALHTSPADLPNQAPATGAYLFGSYQVSVKGDSLILTKTTVVNTYIYRLKKL